jgi:membrane-bound ClpP family serine protease
MIIKKTSWHYKLISWFDVSPSDSLCPYVRQLLTYIVISLLLCFVAVGVAILFGWAPLHVLLALMGIIAISANQLAVGVIIWAIYTLAGVILGGRYLLKKYRECNPYSPVLKEPNIVMAYIKAKKEKFCPTLKFE